MRRVSKSHLHCLVYGHVASVGPFGVASVLLRLCFVLSCSYFLFPNLYWLPSNLPGSSHPAPCWFLAFFCFLFAPDKRLIVVCYSTGFLLPRSCPSWPPNWHSLLHQAERFDLPSTSFSHSKWSEYKQKLYWSISVVLFLWFFSRDGHFQAGKKNHNHVADVGPATAARITKTVKSNAMDDLFKPAPPSLKR